MLEIIVKDRMSEGDKTKLHRHGDQARPLEQTMSSSSIDMSVKRDQGCIESLWSDSTRYFFLY